MGNSQDQSKVQEIKIQIAEMTNTSNRNSPLVNTSLASIKWLKYLGIVLAVLILYVVVHFYYKYGVDVLTKSLTVSQHIKLSIYAVGSMLSELFIPLLFFSGGLLYRLVRLNGIGPLVALKRDLMVILPLGIILWVYGAYGEEPIERKFYAMLFDVQELQSGQKLAKDSKTDELVKGPNLSGLHEKIDTLYFQIKDFEKQFVSNGSPAIKSYLEELHNQQLKYRDEIKVIHFTPLYVLLFLILGLLLGYLLPLQITALLALLIGTGFSWHFITSMFETILGLNNLNEHLFLLGKISVLLILDAILLIMADKAYKRSKELYL